MPKSKMPILDDLDEEGFIVKPSDPMPTADGLDSLKHREIRVLIGMDIDGHWQAYGSSKDTDQDAIENAMIDAGVGGRHIYFVTLPIDEPMPVPITAK